MKKRQKRSVFCNNFFPKSKRGLSTVLTTLIIILLVLVSVGILWGVIKNIISKGSEEVSFGAFTTNLEIKKVYVENENISVIIKRNPGKGDLTGIKFIFYEGVNSEVIERNTSLEELEEKKFVILFGEFEELNLSNIDKVSIASVIKKESEKESAGNILDTYQIKKQSDEPFFSMTGLILWNKLGSDVQVLTSEIGVNGVIPDASPVYVAAKFDNGVSVPAGDNWAYPPIIRFDDAFITDNVTLDFWLVPNWGSTDTENHNALTTYDGNVVAGDGYFDIMASNYIGTPDWQVVAYSPPNSGSAPVSIYAFSKDTAFSAGDKIHIGVSINSSAGVQQKIKFYVNGVSQTLIYTGGDSVWTPYLADIILGVGYSPDCIVDNLKIYDYIKTDFSDRFSE